MRYLIRTYIVIVFLAVISSCSPRQEETAFERVVEYYRSQGDTLKMQAAEYLARYSEYHYGVPRHIVGDSSMGEFIGFDSLHALHPGMFDIYVNPDSVLKAYLDSCGYHMSEEPARSDRDIVDDEYLIENIDLAFETWQRPWSRSVTFDDFCRYILPYRIGSEELSSWRRHFIRKYEASIADSVSDLTSVTDVAQYLMRCVRRDVAYGGGMGPFCREAVAPAVAEQMHYLSCNACAYYAAMALRACGIPCTVIDINWRFTEVGHSSVLVMPCRDSERPFRISVGDTLIYMGAAKDTMASYRTWAYCYPVNAQLQKVARYYTSSGRTMPAAISDLVYPLTRDDVTPLMSKTYDFAMPVPDSLQDKRYIYLCRFHDGRWLPVRGGMVDSDSVRFAGATIRQWYRMGYVSGDTLCTFGTAFTLSGDDGISDVRDRILRYDLSGDTVLFRLAYRDRVKDGPLRRSMTTRYWGADQRWHTLTGDAVLWGFNPKTGEYREFDESMRSSGFRPDFHLLDVRLPRWTVFYDSILGSPFGYIDCNPETGEGYLMQF